MEIRTTAVAEESAENLPLPGIEEREFDIRAFELWQRASRPKTEEEAIEERLPVGCHSSCL